jgi:hypothetical protein
LGFGQPGIKNSDECPAGICLEREFRLIIFRKFRALLSMSIPGHYRPVNISGQSAVLPFPAGNVSAGKTVRYGLAAKKNNGSNMAGSKTVSLGMVRTS